MAAQTDPDQEGDEDDPSANTEETAQETGGYSDCDELASPYHIGLIHVR